MEKREKSPGERLSEALSFLGLTQAQFTEKFEGNPTQQTISKYITGKLEIPFIFALAIEAICKISQKWLLTGKGEMFITESDQKEQVAVLKKESEFFRSISQTKGLRVMIEDFLLLPTNDQEMIRNMVRNLKSKL
ncbi:helix-turn-helix transcriptional regulator [Leptospira sp. 201903071]|uniref:helix-turn-helix transcriptional regulator n=1 Tax=Leptospira ainazelensis TaxID=2810034 RepID=UPI0019632A0E|nr:helix-turn-helix transcriptional regulator [Leptospira ainazelensis]MBM9502920.1 helix-turn-helix transcriptional regulator [Leptospira ainazelensis]